ncbi:MAG: hypothetical protein IPH59_10590 [bacterium]|nr:hypothetical protein [bacterium]
MNRKITAIAVAGAAILAFAVGCTDKQMESAYQASLTQVAAQADSIRMLKNEMRVKTDSLNYAMETMHSASFIADSVSQDYQKAKTRAANLSKELKNLTAEYNTLQSDCSKREAELLAGISERDSVLMAIDAMFSDTNTTLGNVRSELIDEKTRTEWHADLLAKIKPWYKKWKHDSKRSFLKVLFAAGKAKKPDFEEPNIDTLMPPIQKLQQTVPADTSKIDGVSMNFGEPAEAIDPVARR